MGCQGGGGGKIDKRNVALEPESLKTWVAKGGGGEKLIKGMLHLNLNH